MQLSLIQNKIYEIRGQKVMLDFDLAALYEVETKRLKEAVKRNINRFPPDFMFQLRKNEFESLRSQIATSKREGHDTSHMLSLNKVLPCCPVF
jgi:hypothetical protein